MSDATTNPQNQQPTNHGLRFSLLSIMIVVTLCGMCLGAVTRGSTLWFLIFLIATAVWANKIRRRYRRRSALVTVVGAMLVCAGTISVQYGWFISAFVLLPVGFFLVFSGSLSLFANLVDSRRDILD